MPTEPGTHTRRDVLLGAGAVPLVVACDRAGEHARTASAASASHDAAAPATSAAARALGKTGAPVEAVSLGGEGILRTTGRTAEATAMLRAAFAAGVRYCDTAPAYADSQDYYGAAFRASPGARERVFLASK